MRISQTSRELKELLEKAGRVYKDNFPEAAWFGKCIFISWYCSTASCRFCFRAAQNQKHSSRTPEQARRSPESIVAEAIIAKNLGWRIEFLTGGCDSYPFEELLELCKKVSAVYGHKIWVNLGLFNKEQLLKLKPYVEGVCASIETTAPELHDHVCPDKPIKPYEELLRRAGELGFKKSICIIIGLGEKRADFESLSEFIKKNQLDRITFYALKPVKGSDYDKSPEPEEYAWWIARTRIEFPKLEIMGGLTPKKPEYAEWVLRAGANAVTKFPAIRAFAGRAAHTVEESAEKTGRSFLGSLNELPELDWKAEVEKLKLDNDFKQKVMQKLELYLRRMSRNSSAVRSPS